jgi:hypothetical protein
MASKRMTKRRRSVRGKSRRGKKVVRKSRRYREGGVKENKTRFIEGQHVLLNKKWQWMGVPKEFEFFDRVYIVTEIITENGNISYKIESLVKGDNIPGDGWTVSENKLKEYTDKDLD